MHCAEAQKATVDEVSVKNTWKTTETEGKVLESQELVFKLTLTRPKTEQPPKAT
jgi:hypothetical protein